MIWVLPGLFYRFGGVACLSFVATEISALTIVGVPAAAYSENWEYVQFFIGFAAARLFVDALFIPVFYKYDASVKSISRQKMS